MHSLRKLAPLWALLLSVSCDSDPTPQSGTRTHWLMSCEADTDCSSDSVCVCEVCTSPCSEDAECGDGICPSLTTTHGVCGSSQEGRYCLPRETTQSCQEPIEPQFGFGGSTGSSCGDDSTLLCDDFASPLEAGYQISFEDTQLSHQSCLPDASESAVSYRGLANEGFGHVQMSLNEELVSGDVHFRFRVLVPEGQSNPGLLRLFAFRNEPEFSADQLGVHLTEDGGLRVSSADGFEDSAPGFVTPGEWTCIRGWMDVHEQATIRLFVGDELALQRDGVKTLPETGPYRLAVLFGSIFEPKPEFEVTIDDVQVSRTALSCIE